VSKFKCSVLVVAGADVTTDLRGLLAADFEVLSAPDAAGARVACAASSVDLILADDQLPDGDGIGLLDWAARTHPSAARVLLTPCSRIEDGVDAVNRGRAHRFVLKPWRPGLLLETLRGAARGRLLERSHEGLLQELRTLNLELEARVEQRTRELAEANRQLQLKNSILEKMALTDSLTGLPNRRALERVARKEIARRQRSPRPLTLGIVDADHFKDINSRFLLSGGDHALAWLGRELTAAVRAADTVGRIGGEEFLVVAPETDFDGAEVLGERLRSTVEHGSTEFEGRRITLTVSVGLAAIGPDGPVTYEALKQAADAALAAAKEAGRNRVVVCRVAADA
jgi:diguanylate cyclase (GGDEF)-like protein